MGHSAEPAPLAQLTSAANDTDIPERLQNLVSPQPDAPIAPKLLEESPAPATQERAAADHLAGFFDAMGFMEGDDRRTMLAKQISDIITQQNRYETAEDLRRRFDPPATCTPDNGEELKPRDGDKP